MRCKNKEVIDRVIDELGIDLFANVMLEIDIKEVIENNEDDRRTRILKKLLEVMEIKKVENVDLMLDVHQLIVNK
ncbi:hypothetical protein GEO21_22935 [Sphingobacterium faecium]|uniref:hypothetical protein n=1 Tax=Sphingobacterium faecium TaxID=34087 RepID=UPI0012911951|nr:hypothetical protein [Sphingobacterium faecium]MQP30336.1 hypothetical protein [Sphingobacterium faecium]